MNNIKPKFEEKFNEKLNLFKEYIEEFHELPSSSTIYKEVPLGMWIQNQKQFQKNGKLSEERIQMLNDVNPFWNGTSEEKKIENKRLLISSDWKLKVPEGNHPLDDMLSEDELYRCLSLDIYDYETLIRLNYFGSRNVYDYYAKIIDIDPNYALLLSAIYGYSYTAGLESTKRFFESFAFFTKEEMIEKIDQMFIGISERYKRIIEYRFGLKDGELRTLNDVSRFFGVTRTRIRELEDKTMRLLRDPRRINIIRKTNTVLDELPIDIRRKLYKAGIDTIEKIEYSLKDYSITDHNIRTELESLLLRIKEGKDKEIDLSQDITELDLSIRPSNCLYRKGITTIAQLKELCDDDPNLLCKIRNMGRKSSSEIIYKLNDLLGTNYEINI